MKSVLLIVALATTSFAHAAVTREFDHDGASVFDAATEQFYHENDSSRAWGNVTESGDISTSLNRWYSGSSQTSATWSSTFTADGSPYTATLNFVPSSINLFVGFDVIPAGTTSAGFEWLLYANDDLVWSSGVTIKSSGSDSAQLVKTGADLGGDFVFDNTEGDYMTRHGSFTATDTQTQVDLGSFVQGSAVELRYVLNTHIGVAENICGECMTMWVNVGDPLVISPGTPSLQIAAVPEPETYAMLGLGLMGVALASRRKKQ